MIQCLSMLQSMGLFLQQWCNATSNVYPAVFILLVFCYIFERWKMYYIIAKYLYLCSTLGKIIMKSEDIWSPSNAYNTCLFFCNTLQSHQYGLWCHNWRDFPAQMAHDQWIAKWYFPTVHKLIQLYRAVFLICFPHFLLPSYCSFTIPPRRPAVSVGEQWEQQSSVELRQQSCFVIKGDVYCWWSGLTTTFNLPLWAHVSNDVD